MYNIAIGGISTECTSYSPLEQKREDFKRIKGKKLIQYVEFNFKKYKELKIHPIFFEFSIPGGPINYKYFLAFKNEFISRIKKKPKLDGFLLLMHGAIFIKKIKDPEGYFLKEIRNIVGNKCKIGISYDLHGNVTQKIINNIDYFSAFKTAPHIDIKTTYKRVLQMIINGILRKKTNYLSWVPIPVLVSGEMTSTLVEPCKSIYKSLDKYNRMINITDCNLLIGYVWADSVRATAAAVVNSTNKISGDKICKKIANDYFKNRHKLNFDMISDKIENIYYQIGNNFTILADSGDNPTAGGVGDRADVLKYFIHNNFEKKVLFAGIASPLAYMKLLKNRFNSVILGGEFGHSGESVKIIPNTVRFKNKCSIITYKKITIVITKYRRPFHFINDFVNLKLKLSEYNILVVKSGYLSPDLKSLKVKSFMLLTDGVVKQDIKNLVNNNRKRPTYPFQSIDNFKIQVI